MGMSYLYSGMKFSLSAFSPISPMILIVCEKRFIIEYIKMMCIAKKIIDYFLYLKGSVSYKQRNDNPF